MGKLAVLASVAITAAVTYGLTTGFRPSKLEPGDMAAAASLPRSMAGRQARKRLPAIQVADELAVPEQTASAEPEAQPPPPRTGPRCARHS
jgi:hypothetical protein